MSHGDSGDRTLVLLRLVKVCPGTTVVRQNLGVTKRAGGQGGSTDEERAYRVLVEYESYRFCF